MPFLPGFAVVFLGLAGGDKNVAKQVATLVKDLHLPTKPVPAQTLRTLTHHSSGAKELVQKLHVDGAIGFEVVTGHGPATLRVVIYTADGSLKTLSETSLGKAGLSRDDLSVLRANLSDDVGSLAPGKDDGVEITDEADVEPAVAKPPAVKAAPAVAAPPATKAAPAVKPAPAAKPAPAGKPVQSDDDESPLGAPPAKKAAAAPAPSPAPADDESPLPVRSKQTAQAAAPAKQTAQAAAPAKQTAQAAAPAKQTAQAAAPAKQTAQAAAPTHEEVAAADDSDAHDSDAVDASEIEALTAGATAETTGAATPASLHLGVSLGLGIAGRSFAPGPATVAAYSSRPVGTIAGEGYISPTPRTTVAVRGERTLLMTTPVGDQMATTTISRWEAVGRYAAHRGTVEIAPMLGFGRRAFTIRSSDPSRSPDGDYNYLIAGAAGSVALGRRVSLQTAVALEPVLFGAEPTEAAFGEATRWATDITAGIEVRLNPHVLARLAADYQRFMWSWDMAGDRGAGGAVDNYVSGVLSLGAGY